MLSIHLQNLQFKAYHGLYNEEKILGNQFIVNITIKYQPQSNSITHINQTINYVSIYELIKKRMAIATPLLETVAIEITNEILECFLLANEVDICITKKHPPIQNFIGNVAVSFNKKRV